MLLKKLLKTVKSLILPQPRFRKQQRLTHGRPGPGPFARVIPGTPDVLPTAWPGPAEHPHHPGRRIQGMRS